MSAVQAEAPPLADAVRQALGGEGALAAALPGFIPRPSQQALSVAVASSMIRAIEGALRNFTPPEPS